MKIYEITLKIYKEKYFKIIIIFNIVCEKDLKIHLKEFKNNILVYAKLK